MGVRRMWAYWRASRRWWALALAGGALMAIVLRVPAELATDQHFPAHTPAVLAHALADFSNQPHVTSWWVEEDHSNYTTWRYKVSYVCGRRCAGAARVLAHDEPLAAAAPQHGHAAHHHVVSVVRQECTTLPLLSWPQFCDEAETSAVVSVAAGGGARLRETARTSCSALAALSGACARRLRAHQHLWHVRLRAGRHLPPPAATRMT